LPLAALAFRDLLLQPWVFTWLLSFAIYLSLKWLTWWTARSRIAHPAWRSCAYLLAWPGTDADSFLDVRQHVPPPAPKTITGSIVSALAGYAIKELPSRLRSTSDSAPKTESRESVGVSAE